MCIYVYIYKTNKILSTYLCLELIVPLLRTDKIFYVYCKVTQVKKVETIFKLSYIILAKQENSEVYICLIHMNICLIYSIEGINIYENYPEIL